MNSTNIVTYFENSSNFTYDLHPPKSIVPNRPKHCSFTGSSIQHLHQGWETAGSLGFFASWEAMPMSQSLKYPRSQNRGHQNEHISSTYHQISNMKVGFGGFFLWGGIVFKWFLLYILCNDGKFSDPTHQDTLAALLSDPARPHRTSKYILRKPEKTRVLPSLMINLIEYFLRISLWIKS